MVVPLPNPIAQEGQEEEGRGYRPKEAALQPEEAQHLPKPDAVNGVEIPVSSSPPVHHWSPMELAAPPVSLIFLPVYLRKTSSKVGSCSPTELITAAALICLLHDLGNPGLGMVHLKLDGSIDVDAGLDPGKGLQAWHQCLRTSLDLQADRVRSDHIFEVLRVCPGLRSYRYR